MELGARAARGDFPSQILAARVLRTLAEAAGRPLSDDPVPAGLEVIETAFATVLQWAVGPDWASASLALIAGGPTPPEPVTANRFAIGQRQTCAVRHGV